jgi:hypothetical protein
MLPNEYENTAKSPEAIDILRMQEQWKAAERRNIGSCLVAPREVGASCNAPLNDANRSDKTRNAGRTAFGGYRLQFRENECERIVERACTGFAHDPLLTI